MSGTLDAPPASDCTHRRLSAFRCSRWIVSRPSTAIPRRTTTTRQAVLAAHARHPARRIAVAGDSAGGALAIATMLAASDAGEQQVAGAAPYCPWVDPRSRGGRSMVSNERFDMMMRENLVTGATQYASDNEITSPAITPRVGEAAGRRRC